MIYFVESPDGTAIKIGKAADVPNRLSMLQTGNHERLKLLAVLNWPDAYEQALHLQWAHLRVRGEWFRATWELRHFIAGEVGYETYERVLAGNP